MTIIKSKTEAIALYAEAMALEETDTSAYTPEEKAALSQQIIDLMTLAQNTCPHETEIRRADLDAGGVEVYECQDCFNHNYIQAS